MKIISHAPLCIHEVGKRDNNEDNIYPPKGGKNRPGSNPIFMVCDGVGGLAKGEVASQIVCDVIAGELENSTTISRTDVEKAVRKATSQISQHQYNNEDSVGMATTLTLLVFHNKGALIAHIGDSRVYHLRDGRILFKTKDHSFVNELLNENLITPAEALNHPKKNVVTKAILAGEEHQPDIVEITDIQKGDFFFLCSDGITESLSDMVLLEILSDRTTEDEDKIKFIKQYCQEGSNDNYSAYLIKIDQVEKWNDAAPVAIESGNNQSSIKPIVALAIIIFGGIIWAYFSTKPSSEKLLAEQTKKEALNKLDDLNTFNIPDYEDEIKRGIELVVADEDGTTKEEMNLLPSTSVTKKIDKAKPQQSKKTRYPVTEHSVEKETKTPLGDNKKIESIPQVSKGKEMGKAINVLEKNSIIPDSLVKDTLASNIDSLPMEEQDPLKKINNQDTVPMDTISIDTLKNEN